MPHPHSDISHSEFEPQWIWSTGSLSHREFEPQLCSDLQSAAHHHTVWAAGQKELRQTQKNVASFDVAVMILFGPAVCGSAVQWFEPRGFKRSQCHTHCFKSDQDAAYWPMHTHTHIHTRSSMRRGTHPSKRTAHAFTHTSHTLLFACRPCGCLRTHPPTHPHTHIHTHTHTCTHKHTYKHAEARAEAHSHPSKHTAHAFTHTSHTLLFACRPCGCLRTQIWTHTYKHTHTHTCVHLQGKRTAHAFIHSNHTLLFACRPCGCLRTHSFSLRSSVLASAAADAWEARLKLRACNQVVCIKTCIVCIETCIVCIICVETCIVCIETCIDWIITCIELKLALIGL